NLVFNIDKIIINEMLGLSATGVYTIAFFFGTLVVIPSRPLLRISGTLIADAWRKNDLSYIDDIYKRSCLNQFIIGAFLFGGIWVNIDNILVILGPEYIDGKWVIFFIGLGYLIDMGTGANNRIIAYSKYYRMSLWFLLILIVLVISTMYLLIPVWGITGAAIAIALSFFANNLMRFLFLFKKYHFQPFSYRFLLIPGAFLLAYGIGTILPQLPLVWDILVRGSVFAVVYLLLVTGFRVSEDVNNTILSISSQLKKWISRK
ncbi:MAG: polysaccharide biosynthesis C-terminal domain-containing protein, partial [Bacteroidota bacterium]